MQLSQLDLFNYVQLSTRCVYKYLYIAACNKPDFAFEFSFVPIGINLFDNTDNVVFVER